MDIAQLPPAQLRALLPDWLLGYVRSADAAQTAEIRAAADAAVAAMDDATITEGLAAYAALGDGYTIHRAHPMAQRLGRAFMAPITQGSEVVGAARLEALTGRPQVWIGNHLSYVDTQATDALLTAAGLSQIADRLLTVAGPKVYSDPFRRLAALGVNTLKTPQSSTLSTNESAMSPRELAKLAISCVRAAEQWRVEQGPVLIYPEGTRSRTGQLGPFLRAVARYVRATPELVIVPVCVSGTERLFPMDERMYPQPVRLAVGEPFLASEAGRGKTAVLEEARRRLLDVAPEAYKPEDGVSPVD